MKKKDQTKVISSPISKTIHFTIVFIILNLMIHDNVQAQTGNPLRTELGLLSGASNFIGDIEGKYNNTQPSMINLQTVMSTQVFGAFIRQYLSPTVAIRVNTIYATISGSDKSTTDQSRQNRNLHFRSDIFEVSIQTELTIIKSHLFSKKNPHEAFANANRAKIDSILNTASKGNTFRLYTFGGVGIFKFKPQAEYNGVWYDLQPFGTEGQGINPSEGGAPIIKKYSLTELVLPIGIGLSYETQNGLTVGFEFGWRKTFTDYLDDVSGNYADNSKIEAQHGDVAAKLANRTPEITSNPAILNNYTTGSKRGNPNVNDSYFFSLLTISYVL
ncbi:MAG: hypothetical protein IH946_01810 [Bacteroidetes bacterium]|nr:hypothetical protein [Bacteroidota bacterium]